jgi:starvation-inducible outer membrane lipoprotein
MEYIDGFKYTYLKIQKTLPTQGYHVWHLEQGTGKENSQRALVFTIYLNDVEEGGETEFLHQSIRAKPIKGRCVIWPAAFSLCT